MDNLDIKRVAVDLEAMTVELESRDGAVERHALDSEEGFLGISEAWIRSGWFAKYVYSFSWLGRPIIQLPEDVLRIQEVIYAVQPDVIVETGVAHGGSLVLYASLCRAMGRGRVVGVDIEIRPHNRAAIEAHELFDLITLIEGDAIAPATVDEVHRLVGPGERVLVLLDSHHAKDHVRAELEAYGPLVSVGSYIVATDGVMEQLVGGPRAGADWAENNPRAAAREFAAASASFELVEPPFAFNEGVVTRRVTHWPGAFLQRVR